MSFVFLHDMQSELLTWRKREEKKKKSSGGGGGIAR